MSKETEAVSLEDLRKEWQKDIASMVKPPPIPLPATPHTAESHLRPHEDEQAHPVYSFMRSCPNCGKPNTEYRPSPYRCKNCKVPVNLEGEKCWNCGDDEAEKNDEPEE